MIIGTLLLGSMLAFAQSDSIAGVWSGHMGREGERMPIVVTFKVDGQSLTGTVTGPPSPGTVRKGSFDPKTGALRFEVVVQDGGNAVALFEGTVEKGIASGKVTLGGDTGEFRLSRGGAGESRLAAASRGDEGSAVARRGFTEVSGWVTRAAELVPADKYTYRPTSTVRTFGQLLAHVVDAYQYYCARGAGREAQWTDAIEKGATDKATLAQRLRQATDACSSAYAGAGQLGPLLENVAHTSLHYGNMITYMRLLGLTPPSS